MSETKLDLPRLRALAARLALTDTESVEMLRAVEAEQPKRMSEFTPSEEWRQKQAELEEQLADQPKPAAECALCGRPALPGMVVCEGHRENCPERGCGGWRGAHWVGCPKSDRATKQPVEAEPVCSRCGDSGVAEMPMSGNTYPCDHPAEFRTNFLLRGRPASICNHHDHCGPMTDKEATKILRDVKPIDRGKP